MDPGEIWTPWPNCAEPATIADGWIKLMYCLGFNSKFGLEILEDGLSSFPDASQNLIGFGARFIIRRIDNLKIYAWVLKWVFNRRIFRVRNIGYNGDFATFRVLQSEYIKYHRQGKMALTQDLIFRLQPVVFYCKIPALPNSEGLMTGRSNASAIC